MNPSPETRFRATFAHLGEVTAYAARRGSLDPEGVAAETMAIAWRKLADVPEDDPRPWLYATARNLLHAEWRRRRRAAGDSATPKTGAPEPREIDAEVAQALRQHGLVRFIEHFAREFPDIHLKDVVVDHLGPHREMGVDGRTVINSSRWPSGVLK